MSGGVPAAAAGKPAQQVLVERFISWERVEERLGRYPAIGRTFPLDLLRRHQTTPPYHCHYLAWRLGVWDWEGFFPRFDRLLTLAESLPGWAGERSLIETPEYAAFWSLVWQLQMAEHLCAVGRDVRWGNPGPDLSVEVSGRRLFVECYVFRKSFGIKLYLEDVLGRLGDDIKLDHDYCLPFSLPQNDATASFLDSTLRPFLDAEWLGARRAKAQVRYPIVLAKPASSLVIYLDGDEPAEYDPLAVPSPTGDPDAHLDLILREAVGQKSGANALERHQPNLVAVNYLLSTDAQVAFHLRGAPRRVTLPASIDGFAVAPGVGIDARLNRSQLVLVAAGDPREAVLDAVAGGG